MSESTQIHRNNEGFTSQTTNTYQKPQTPTPVIWKTVHTLTLVYRVFSYLTEFRKLCLKWTCFVRCPPQRDPILSFSHTFLPKNARIGGRRPSPTDRRPPQWEILDPKYRSKTLQGIELKTIRSLPNQYKFLNRKTSFLFIYHVGKFRCCANIH